MIRKMIVIAVATSLATSCSGERGSGPQEVAGAPLAAPTPAKELSDIADIAGIELGKPIVVPECRKERAYGLVMYAEKNVSYPCFKEKTAGGVLASKSDLAHGPEHDGVQDIELGEASVPAGVSPKAKLLMLGSAPEEVVLDTTGAESQRRIYDLLVAKYGEPTSSNIDELQNALGAKLQSIRATWETKRMDVRFYGVLGTPATGRISATTSKGAAFWEARRPEPAESF